MESKTLKSKSELNTSTGSAFFKCEFTDGSNFTFFRSGDVEKLRTIPINSIITFTAYKKGDWNNGKDINESPAIPINEKEESRIVDPLRLLLTQYKLAAKILEKMGIKEYE